MTISVDLALDDGAFLDAYARTHEVPSRSATLRVAVELLRASELGDAYEAAWAAWTDDGHADAWDGAAAQ